MRGPLKAGLARWTVAILAVACIGIALWTLRAAGEGLRVETMTAGGTPMTVFRPPSGGAAPVVLIAHGFAGSQQLMRPFAMTLARSGYVAVTFDFAGHGRNPRPLTGNITKADGATRTLVDETARVAAASRGLGDGRLAVLGHSMASDIIVRFAESRPDVAATVAVSMFSPAVTATAPRNLLVIVGDWEGGLKREALRAVGLASAPAAAEPGVTYGDFAAGTARMAVFSPATEHVSVLYSRESLAQAVAWMDRAFGRGQGGSPPVDGQGPAILLLLFGVVILAWPLSSLLPEVTARPAGAGLPWRSLAVPLAVPAVLTPVLLRFLPTHFLPVLVGDYLAVHFAVYGLVTAACLLWLRRGAAKPASPVSKGRLAAAALAMIAYGFVAIIWPIDTFVTSFVPGGTRLLLVLAMLVGTLSFFLSTEWLTRGEGAARGAYSVAKLAFVVSLALAVALDFQRLFFLLIIVPVIALYFVVYGLFSAWAYRSTHHPFVAGLANAVAFAWAIAVTFPLLAG